MKRKGMNMNQNEGFQRFTIVYFLGLVIVFVVNFIPYYRRKKLYKTDPKTSESRERMKFITKYSPDEVVWKLRCRGAGEAIGYEVKKESDAVLLLIVKGVQGSFSRNTVEREAKYKMAIKQEGEHTAIWVFLLEYSDEEVKDRYGWELKGFLIKKLEAEIVEFDLGRKEPER